MSSKTFGPIAHDIQVCLKTSWSGDTCWTATNRREYGFYAAAETQAFRKKLASGHLIPHQYYARIDSTQYRRVGKMLVNWTDGNYYHYQPRVFAPPVGDVVFDDLCDPVVVTQKVNDARSRAGCNIIAMQQEAFADMLPDLDLLTTALEAKETVDMFVNLKTRAEDLLRRKRRGYAGSGLMSVSSIDAIADARMEWRYGWKLLLLDIENAVDAYNNPVRPIIITGRSRPVRDSWSESEAFDLVHDPSHNYGAEWKKEEEYSAYVSAAAELRLVSKNFLASPAVSLWEMAKLSFVADWFVSVGDAIAAWEVIRKTRSSTSSFNQKWTLQCEKTDIGASTTATNVSSVQRDGSEVLKCEARLRDPLGAVSYIPQVRIDLNVDRLLDGATILRSKFKR